MRIKRFIATDMRSALAMVREEHGPEAVILSSRATADGIEVVAAMDYDEALVHQALRAATEGMASSAAGIPPVPPAATAPAAVVDAAPAVAPTQAPTPRDSFAARARAVFGIGDGPDTSSNHKLDREPTLAELTGAFPLATPATHAPTARPAATPPPHFEAMMAALADRTRAPDAVQATDVVTQISSRTTPLDTGPASNALSEHVDSEPFVTISSLASMASMAKTLPATAVPIDVQLEATAPSITEVAETAEVAKVPAPLLHAVAEPDPGITAMREELTSMRRMIEREMGQFTAERLRGSPGRSAAYDLLLGYGCDESLAQSVVAKLNPALRPDQIRPPMLAELARMLTITRSEPIDDGGVIALIGPTGAGKTTTVAKLAARFAERHRARDVAMVTTDSERVGAIEQLHAHGRRLGITVCEARGAESLAQTLEQLQDYPLVLVDTAGYGARDRALLGQVTWLRATRQLRSLLVMPANAHPHDLNELVRRYRMASPEGVVLTKTDETGRLGAALSVAVHNDLSLAYTSHGQQVSGDLEAADASNLVLQLEKLRRAADNPFATEDHHAIA